jgi:hypothetical protein
MCYLDPGRWMKLAIGARPRAGKPIEKAQFGQGNPRKSKLFSLREFGWGLAGLGPVLIDLGLIWMDGDNT